VNAVGATAPNATSRPFIRSHVMREANRLTYSPTTGQSVDPSSAAGPQTQEQSQPQVQRFRIGPSGLQPMLPSRRSRRGQIESEIILPSSPLEEIEEYNRQDDLQQAQGASTHELYDTRYAMAQFPSDVGLHGSEPYIRDDSHNPVAQNVAQDIIPAHWPMNIPPSNPTDRPVHLSSLAGEQMDPFNSLPISNSSRAQMLLHHCK
jgi:hypothetical protein